MVCLRDTTCTDPAFELQVFKISLLPANDLIREVTVFVSSAYTGLRIASIAARARNPDLVSPCLRA